MAQWVIRRWKTATALVFIGLMELWFHPKNTLNTLAQTTTLQRLLGAKRCFHFQ